MRSINLYTIEDRVPNPSENIILVDNSFIFGKPDVYWKVLDNEGKDTYENLPYDKDNQPWNTRLYVTLRGKEISNTAEYILVNDLFPPRKVNLPPADDQS